MMAPLRSAGEHLEPAQIGQGATQSRFIGVDGGRVVGEPGEISAAAVHRHPVQDQEPGQVRVGRGRPTPSRNRERRRWSCRSPRGHCRAARHPTEATPAVRARGAGCGHQVTASVKTAGISPSGRPGQVLGPAIDFAGPAWSPWPAARRREGSRSGRRSRRCGWIPAEQVEKARVQARLTVGRDFSPNTGAPGTLAPRTTRPATRD